MQKRIQIHSQCRLQFQYFLVSYLQPVFSLHFRTYSYITQEKKCVKKKKTEPNCKYSNLNEMDLIQNSPPPRGDSFSNTTERYDILNIVKRNW